MGKLNHEKYIIRCTVVISSSCFSTIQINLSEYRLENNCQTKTSFHFSYVTLILKFHFFLNFLFCPILRHHQLFNRSDRTGKSGNPLTCSVLTNIEFVISIDGVCVGSQTFMFIRCCGFLCK